MTSERRPTRRGSNWPSLVFGALAVGLAALAIILALRNNEPEGPPPPPAAQPGENELIHVVQALQGQNLEVVIAQRGVPAGQLSVPGQGLTVDGSPLYVFVYPDAAAAEAEAATDPATVLPARSASGTPLATETPRRFTHSNVTLALVGGSDELARSVPRAIERLP